MKLILTLMAFSLMMTSAFAGEMKKIDQETRETVAQAYFVGESQEEYFDYINNEIMNLNLTASEDESCLVIVTGHATNMNMPEFDMFKFWVCITKDAESNYNGKIIKDEKLDL